MERFRWLQLCIWLGAYHPLMRELRFALESCIQAYCVDKGHPDAKLDYKFEALEEIENQRLIGTKLIHATDLQNKNEMKDIYFYLSKYTHSSPVELNEIKNIMLQESLVIFDLFDTVSNFAFNADLFHKAEELTNKTMDVVYYVCLSLFPEVRKKLKQEENVINSLKELNCTISKDYIEKIGE